MSEKVTSDVRTAKIQISLRDIFTGRTLASERCEVSSFGERRLRSDCADVQADLSLLWAHMSEGTFSHVSTTKYQQVLSYNQ